MKPRELLHVLPTAASCRRPADRGDTARLFTDPALNVRLQNGVRVRSLSRCACRAQHIPKSSPFDQPARGICSPPSARHAVPGLPQIVTHFGSFYGFGERERGCRRRRARRTKILRAERVLCDQRRRSIPKKLYSVETGHPHAHPRDRSMAGSCHGS